MHTEQTQCQINGMNDRDRFAHMRAARLIRLGRIEKKPPRQPVNNYGLGAKRLQNPK